MRRTRAWERRTPRRALAIDVANALLVPQPISGGNGMIAGEFDVVVVGPAMAAFAPR
jgi:hypothetical protein